MMMVMMADAAGKLRREDTAAADVDAVVVALSMFVSQ